MKSRMKKLEKLLRIYLVPAAVLQSVLVGGGYGTGRELVEYFTQYGMLGGFYGIGVSAIVFFVVILLTYTFAVEFRLFDYKSFLKALVGRYWIAFEMFFLTLLLLVLAVVGSAAGNILRDSTGIPYELGLTLMLVLVSLLIFVGREPIIRILTFWSIILYAVFFVYMVLVFDGNLPSIARSLGDAEVRPGWFVSGINFALYNLAILPAVLFSIRGLETRREAFLSATVSAVFCLVPALMLHASFGAGYPAVVNQPVPIFWMIQQLGAPAFIVFYMIALFGTFIETGAGFIQGVIERVDRVKAVRGRGRGRKYIHVAVCLFLLLASITLSFAGIIELVATGYEAISYGILFTYVLPLCTVGLWKLSRGKFAGELR